MPDSSRACAAPSCANSCCSRFRQSPTASYFPSSWPRRSSPSFKTGSVSNPFQHLFEPVSAKDDNVRTRLARLDLRDVLFQHFELVQIDDTRRSDSGYGAIISLGHFAGGSCSACGFHALGVRQIPVESCRALGYPSRRGNRPYPAISCRKCIKMRGTVEKSGLTRR